MPEKILLDLTSAEAELFESQYGNNPKLLLDEAGVDLKPNPPRRRWPIAAIAALGVSLFASMFFNFKQDKQNRIAWQTNIDLQGKIDAANIKFASNYLVPKNLDALSILNEKSGEKKLDVSGRNRIAVAITNGDLTDVVYWFGRGTDINQPRYGGKWTHDEDGKATGFIRDFTRTGMSPMQIAAHKGKYLIIKYFLHQERAGKVSWGYTNQHHTETVRDILARRKHEAGENAPPILDELLLLLANL